MKWCQLRCDAKSDGARTQSVNTGRVLSRANQWRKVEQHCSSLRMRMHAVQLDRLANQVHRSGTHQNCFQDQYLIKE